MEYSTTVLEIIALSNESPGGDVVTAECPEYARYATISRDHGARFSNLKKTLLRECHKHSHQLDWDQTKLDFHNRIITSKHSWLVAPSPQHVVVPTATTPQACPNNCKPPPFHTPHPKLRDHNQSTNPKLTRRQLY